jgi:hypothetical protein
MAFLRSIHAKAPIVLDPADKLIVDVVGPWSAEKHDRIAPVRRGSHIEIPDFSKIASPADDPKAHAAILSAVAADHLTRVRGQAIQ